MCFTGSAFKQPGILRSMVATPSKKMNLGSRDFISGLPDCLISKILSFVPTKEAASTSVLAKRWRYLFAHTPNLDFDDSIYLIPEVCNEKKTAFPVAKKKKKIPRSFVDFVDRALVLHQYVPLNRFSLKCEDIVHPAIVIGWILKVIGRGVIDLDLDLSTEWYCPLPSEIFVSETLVRLKMVIGDVLVINVRDVFLPKVKILYLDYVKIKDSVFGKLLSGCLTLEELVLDNLFECKGSFSVTSETLKRLMIYRSRKFDETHERVSFDTPNLLYLWYSDTIANKYPKVKFDSLVEASLDLRMTTHQIIRAKFSNDDRSHPEELVGNATYFLMAICNVKILYLSHQTVEVLNYCCKPIPEFNNLIHLTIKTDPDVSWESLPALLKNCPKLETLVFKGLHHKFINCAEEDGCLCNLREDIPTCLSSSPVKVLKVLKFGKLFEDDDIEDQIKQVQHFLETMPNLEQLILYYDTYFDEDVNEVSTQLQRHPRVSSSNCKIQVISDTLCLSSIVPSPVTTKWGRLM